MNFFRVIACNNRGSLKYYICGMPSLSDSMPLKKTVSILENLASKTGSFNFLRQCILICSLLRYGIFWQDYLISVCQFWLSQDIHYLIISFPLLHLHFINVLDLTLKLWIAQLKKNTTLNSLEYSRWCYVKVVLLI